MKLREKIVAFGSVIVGLLGLVFFFKNKAEDAKVDAILGETKGRDAELEAAEKVIQDKIEAVVNQDDSKLTPEQRANRWEK
jgi:hypothetical protein